MPVRQERTGVCSQPASPPRLDKGLLESMGLVATFDLTVGLGGCWEISIERGATCEEKNARQTENVEMRT